MSDAATLVAEPEQDEGSGFEVHLVNFEGPFDLLLTLIAKHKLDVTEVALSQVTDEFIEYIKNADWDLDETSEFLVVAATLLDLKAARLLPSGEVEDEDDLALLEARDLLFARLLQYKAYKEVAGVLAARLGEESLRFPRAVGLEERFADLLPEVVIGITPQELAQLAAKVLTPKPPPVVGMAHLHQPTVSVREEALVVVDRLRRSRVLTFRTLAADCPSTLHVVARFLSLLELYREKVVAFEQVVALGELTVRWTGDDDDEVSVGAEFDEGDGERAAEDADDD
ncbi:segregation and condensation protein A [Jiangella asiatica]|uniref:segregation and condensation protein A n=1 Tax=Jiangella asiatica TaxID=2530372 RepID=UPI00193CA566|nr:segregation/condensation protein A [Jiangella asiatica]